MVNQYYVSSTTQLNYIYCVCCWKLCKGTVFL